MRPRTPPACNPKAAMNDLGAIWLDRNRCRFRLWAPFSNKVHLHLVAPEDRLIPMESQNLGYHKLVVDSLPHGAQYFYRLANGKDLPDPASRYQPKSVSGPSEAVSHDFDWNDVHW